MVAFVHETALAVVLVVQRPVRQQVVVQRGTAACATADGFPAQVLHHGGDRLQRHRLDQAAHVLMRVVGAFAHGWIGIGHKAVTQCQRHDLFDQPGAGAATGTGLGLAPHQVQRIRPGQNRIHDLAFADAVAATNFRARRQGCNGRHRVRLGTPLKGRAKDQGVAHRLDRGGVFDQPEEPVAIGGIAIQDRADQLAALDHQPFVDAPARIAEHDILAPRPVGKVARAEQVATGNLQLGCGLHRTEGGGFGQKRCSHNPGLIVQRCHKAEKLAVVFDAFAHGKDIRIRGHHLVRNRDPAAHIQMRVIGKPHFRADADGHADQIGTVGCAILQHHGLDVTIAQNGLGGPLAVNLDPPRFQCFLQQVACGGVQLALHQVAHDVDDGHVHPAQLHASGGLQTQEPAADHHRFGPRLRGDDHLFGVVQIAVGADAGQVFARNRNNERSRPGGQDQLVIRHAAPVGIDHLVGAVDLDHRLAKAAIDTARGIPIGVMCDDFAIGLFARQHRRQHDPVVVAARFRVEQDHVEHVGGSVEQMFQHPARGHASANDNKFLFHHAASFLWPCSYSARKPSTSSR